MIKAHCFEREWIEGFRQQDKYRKINPPLVEKMIQAFSLLQYLNTHGLSFIFKGGTSLILLLENANRFSVDIDIVTESNQKTIEQVLDQVVVGSHFKCWKLDEGRSYKPGIPKAHYELEYESTLNKTSNYILLDVLFEKAHYSTIQKKPIQSNWIETEVLIEVSIPTIESITGDKLTAFAPTTTGILYGKGKELEIIKQLFDLSHLFDHITSVEEVFLTYSVFAEQEIAYRGLSILSADILNDTIETCRIISFRERNPVEPDKPRFLELQSGIRSFTNYLITGRFTMDEAVVASSKVAYLCARLLTKNFSPLEKYNGQDIKTIEIQNQSWNVLNKLKRFPDPSGFFYWYKCLEELNML